MKTRKWNADEPTFKEIVVPVKTDHGKGTYRIWAQARPKYCDRGDWMIGIMAWGATNLDDQDGFPRYFFGNEDSVKTQILTWISRRSEIEK